LTDVTSIVLAFAAAFLFGLALVLAQVGLRYVAPLSGAAIAIPSATALFICVAPFALADATPVWAAVPIFAAIGLMFPGTVTLLTFAANRALGPVMTGTLGNLAPLFAVALAFVILGEALRVLQLGGLFAIVAGIVVLTAVRGENAHRWRSWYLLLPLAAAALRGANQATVKLGLEIWPSPFAAALTGYLVSTVVVLTAARLGTGRFVAAAPARADEPGSGEYPARGLIKWWPRWLLWFVAVGWCNGLAALLMYAALAQGSVALVSPLVATYPLVTVVGSTLLFGKVEGGLQLALGVALTVVGVALLIAG
jgi:drug/metabolite transporter (DMT)-like permease